MKKIAIILAGCGHLDGAEIRESVITLLALDRAGASVSIFAPNIEQYHVINHLTGQPQANEKRNVLIEASRIARGNIQDLKQLKVSNFDALILPGGYGVAKNLCDIAFGLEAPIIHPDVEQVILEFYNFKKPIGVICIAPALLVAVLKKYGVVVNVTVGDDSNIVESLGGKHHSCGTSAIFVDEEHKIVSCSAYMRDDILANIAEGIEKLVNKVLSI